MKRLLLLCLMSMVFSVANSQALKRSPIGDKVQQLKEKGEPFQQVELFDRQEKSGRQVELGREIAKGTILSPRTTSLKKAVREKAGTLSLALPDENGQAIELELYQVSPMLPGFQVTTASQGVIAVESTGAHYRGIIKGQHHSLVAISIFDGEMMGLISGEEGTLVLGKLKGENPKNEHILYRERDLASDLDFTCATPDDGVGYTREQLEAPVTMRNVGDCTGIFVEVGNDIYIGKGGVTGTVNYITGLFNEVAVLYNDLDGSQGSSGAGIEIGLSEIYIWDIADPYSGSNSSSNLSAFQSERASFNGDLAIMVNYDVSGGVAAGFSGLCNGDSRQSMCVAGISSSYSAVPTYSWSVMVCAHELGHLFGSRHTHACVWNGDNTAIDGCQRTEGNCRKGPIPSDGGTVMSYCHLNNVGINFTKSFGDQPGNVILNNVNNANCLGASCPATVTTTVGNDPCSNGVQDAGEEGVDCGGSCPTPCGGGGTCDVPTPVNTTGITSRNATMNWSGVSSAVSYDLDIREVGSSSWQTFNTTSTSISLQGFRRNRDYEWQVRANCGGSTSDNSSICTFTTGGAGTQACGSALVFGDLTGEALLVYPNPAKDELNVSVYLPELETVQVRIFDVMGKSVNQVDFESGVSTQSVDVSQFAPGMYFIRVENSGKAYTRKVIIE